MKHFFRYLLFPPVCVGCGERFDLFSEEEIPVFCLKCRVRWESELSRSCDVCGRILPLCTCMPDVLRAAGAAALHKLCRYEPEHRTSVGSHTVLALKDRRVPRAFRFLGDELARGLTMDYPREETLVTYIPRSRDGAYRSGFDQGFELSRAVAVSGGYTHVKLFSRRGGREQKRLTAAERLENVRRSVHLMPGFGENGDTVSLAGKTVLLIDDVVTTGATMAVCTEQLLAAGARRVVGVCVAVDFRGEDGDPDDLEDRLDGADAEDMADTGNGTDVPDAEVGDKTDEADAETGDGSDEADAEDAEGAENGKLQNRHKITDTD